LANREVDIRLVVRDDGSIVLQNTGKKIEQFSRKGKSDIQGMFSAYDNLYTKMATLGGAIVFKEALEGVINLGKLGGEVENVTNAFQRIEGSSALMNQLKTATKGGITELELMRNVLIGIDLGATNDQLITFSRFARFESVRKGRDELEMLQNIMSGVLRGSTELLDNFGISLTELNKRIEQMATESGKSITKLSDVERRQLAVAAATKIMKERLDDLGDIPVTNAEKINQASVAWENLSNKMGTAFSPIVANAAGGISNYLEKINQHIDVLKNQGFGDLSALLIAIDASADIKGESLLKGLYSPRSFPKAGEDKFMGPAPWVGNPELKDDYAFYLKRIQGEGSFTRQPWPPVKPKPKPNPPPPPSPTKSTKKEYDWVGTPWGPVQVPMGSYVDPKKMSSMEIGSESQRRGGKKSGFDLIEQMDQVDAKFEVVFTDAEKLALNATSAIGSSFQALGSQVGSEFNTLWMDIFGQGKTVFDRLAISMLSSFTSSIAELAGQFAAASIMNMILPGSGALIGGLFGRAGGGPVSSGQPYVVGERGPELFIPQQSGRIVPNMSFSDTINVDGFLPENIMQAVGQRRNMQREELIKMIKDLKTVNRMPS
jgi:hypothetical protein